MKGVRAVARRLDQRCLCAHHQPIDKIHSTILFKSPSPTSAFGDIGTLPQTPVLPL